MSRRPEPVITTTTVTGLVNAVASVALFLGFVNVSTTLSGEAQGIGSAAITVVVGVIHVVHAFATRQLVAPMSDPAVAAAVNSGRVIITDAQSVAREVQSTSSRRG